MSLPRRDPNFTMADLEKAGEKFLAAGQEYFDAFHKAGGSGAVIWLGAEDGKLAIFTRGEYRHVLMSNIDQIGQTKLFGATVDESLI